MSAHEPAIRVLRVHRGGTLISAAKKREVIITVLAMRKNIRWTRSRGTRDGYAAVTALRVNKRTHRLLTHNVR